MNIVLDHNEIVKPIILILLAITILRVLLVYVKEYIYDIASSKVHEEIKDDLFTHIQDLEFKYFDDMNTGKLMSRIGWILKQFGKP
ncbi:ABC transporter transmembrane domain-containing protein [Clostridium weizhouense]|uniref:ABC transmembrane type-1 domain-containing protein n=1 Tax=Clostridium weizhouense TaxID=2859781 RepID=A0ABS7AR61_9CLOT|nr:hypothetical protein [Clostridium weizhouense]